MKKCQTKFLLASTAIGTAFTWLSAWFTGWFVDPGSWPLRYTLFGVGFMIMVLFVKLWMRYLSTEQQQARIFFETLARHGEQEILGDSGDWTDLPTLSKDNLWLPVAEQMREVFSKCHRRAEDAEHARVALEVRMQRIRAEQEQTRAILDQLSEPIVAINNFDDVLFANPSAEQLLGFNIEQSESLALKNLIHCQELLEALTDTRRRKAPSQRSSEVELDLGDAKQFYSVTSSSIPATSQGTRNNNSRTHGAVAVLRDISGHKAAQKRNAEFVSSVSHEMKTPLAGIKAYVELLADGDAEDEETREEFFHVINTQIDRLQRLIDNLLNLTRIEAGVVEVSKQARSLNELLDEAFNVVLPTAEEKSIQLIKDTSPLYLGVLADRDMMLQAAINLLSNAIKYTPVGGTVTLRSRMKENEVLFEVEDTGVGLNKEDCQKVFEKFYRVRKDRKMAQGTGLGLPLAKHIVEDVHGGQLSVTSEEGQGSTFRITLPNAGQLTGERAVLAH